MILSLKNVRFCINYSNRLRITQQFGRSSRFFTVGISNDKNTERVKPGYWKDISHQRALFDNIGKQLALRSLEDWYNVKPQQVIDLGGFSVLKHHYKSSLVNALKAVYSEHEWKEWLFSKVPSEFWANPINTRNYFEWAAGKLNIKEVTDWHNVKKQQIIDIQGEGMLAAHKGSLFYALQSAYPHAQWKVWEFSRVTKKFWNDTKNQRLFMDDLAKKFNVNTFEDWYKIKLRDVEDNGGRSLLLRHKNSLIQTLVTIYPEYPWEIWRFEQVSKGFWDNDENVKKFLLNLMEEKKLSSFAELYDLSYEEFVNSRAKTLLNKNGGLQSLLEKVFPSQIQKSQLPEASKTQLLLHRILRKIFPDETIHLNYSHPELYYEKSGRPMKFDIFIPKLNLGFDYFGEQHYYFHYIFGSPVKQQERDQEKLQECTKREINYIRIPYWWNKTIESLKSTIAQKLPNLLPSFNQFCDPIPILPPNRKKEERLDKAVPWTMQLPQATRAIDEDVGWYLTEKYDGIRAYWDGRNLYFANGELIKAPYSFTSQLPEMMPLDGELWSGYNSYDHLSSVVFSDKAEWKNIRYKVFDMPTFGHFTFEQRLEKIRSLVGYNNPIVGPVTYQLCLSRAQLMDFSKEIEKRGGPGVILRKPNSFYYDTNSFLKLERFFDDQVLIIGLMHDLIICKTLLNIDFSIINTSTSKLKIGDVITIRHNGYSDSGFPLSPVFYRKRQDLSWEFLKSKKYPYKLTFGNMAILPHCRGCKRQIRKNELRISADVIFRPPNSGPHPGKIYFCLDRDCISKASLVDHQKDIINPQYPVFVGIVAVPSSVKQKIEEIPDLPGIQFTSL